jgi:pullulanase
MQRAIKTNVYRLDRIAVFNDDFRDGIKGNNFNPRSKGFVSGQTVQEETIKFGITAACFHPQIVYGYVDRSKFPWAKEPWQCVNYASCHDNFTLYDKLVMSSSVASDEEINRMVMMAGALVITSQGIPFLHAGVEMARTKLGDHNSYKSPDNINQIDWNRKHTFSEVYKYYRNLIQLRKNHPAFRMRSSQQIREHLIFSDDYLPGVATYVLVNHANEDEWRTILIVFNGNAQSIKFPIKEHIHWRLVASNTTIDEESTIYPEGKEIEVTGISMTILVED